MSEQTSIRRAHLPDRGVIAVTGVDARTLLQGIITSDIEQLASEPALHAALLTPQGKIIADFFVVTADVGLLLDCPRDRVPDLLKRLAMYRLRAKVDIADVSDTWSVMAVWGEGPLPGSPDGVSFVDPRLAELGQRTITTGAGHIDATADASDYHEHRIALGVPEGGKDYVFGDTFPHEALLDQLHGVSFTKGCYVGQEIVSRMQHRGTARKRIVRVLASGALPKPGAEIAAGEVVIGTLGSVSGHEGLALVRLDRAAEALGKGIVLAAGPSAISIEIQPWATFKLA